MDNLGDFGKLGNYEEVLAASEINNDIAVENHHINTARLMEEISIKKNRYMAAYGARPQYIKLPIRIYEEISHSSICYVRYRSKTKEVFLDCLRCCPTPSISKLEEIELF